MQHAHKSRFNARALELTLSATPTRSHALRLEVCFLFYGLGQAKLDFRTLNSRPSLQLGYRSEDPMTFFHKYEYTFRGPRLKICLTGQRASPGPVHQCACLKPFATLGIRQELCSLPSPRLKAQQGHPSCKLAHERHTQSSNILI